MRFFDTAVGFGSWLVGLFDRLWSEVAVVGRRRFEIVKHDAFLKEPLWNHDRVAWTNDVSQLDVHFHSVPFLDANNFDSAYSTALTDTAGQRQRLKYRGIPLNGVGARVLHLAEDVYGLGARDKDRVAVAQWDVLSRRAALQLL